MRKIIHKPARQWHPREEGYQDRLEQRPLDSNPYGPSTRKALDWLEGWHNADRQLRRLKTEAWDRK